MESLILNFLFKHNELSTNESLAGLMRDCFW